MNHDVIITCAVTGAGDTTAKHSGVPVTPESVAEAAISAAQAGAVFPYQSEQRLPFSLALGDISMVTLDEGAEGLMLPSKLSYYMAAGSAILGVCSGENDLRDTIECADCGICVPPNHPQQLAAAITRMVDNPDLLSRYRTNARKSAESTYSRKICMEFLASKNYRFAGTFPPVTIKTGRVWGFDAIFIREDFFD